jgi:predicted O-linked N-acetylglucosamine transferase (SPINDLY family)
MQVAPIMATGYGHPVSTFGSRVDYFIGGLDSEIPELATINYSERLVLIPGIGAHPVFPNYKRKIPQPQEFIINCCWTAPKINYPMLMALREIKQRASRPVKFQFFPSWTISRYQSSIPFLRSIDTFFEGSSTVYFDTPYQQYLEYLENGRFTLDSYPFGGYNTIVDSLFVGCPVVTLEGTRFFNRASSALMRKVNLSQLITTCRADYINKALELIDNPQGLQSLRDAVTAIDMKALLVDTEEPMYFANAVDYLIQHHSELKQSKTREPLILA